MQSPFSPARLQELLALAWRPDQIAALALGLMTAAVVGTLLLAWVVAQGE